MPKGKYVGDESTIPLRGIVRGGQLVGVVDQDGVERGIALVDKNKVTGGVGIYVDDSLMTNILNKRVEKAPTPIYGDAINVADFPVLAGAPVLSVAMGPNGKPALKVVCSSAASVEIGLNPLLNTLFSGELYMAVHGGLSDGVYSLSMYATPDANYNTNYVNTVYIQEGTSQNSPNEQGGAYTVKMGKQSAKVTGAVTYPFLVQTTKLRITPLNASGCVLYLYAIGTSPQPVAGRVCVTFDDGYDSFFAMGNPLFQDRGIPTTLGVIPMNMSAGGLNAYMRQLQAHVNSGGAIVAHGPNVGAGSGNLFSVFTNTTDRLADMKASRKWIADNGLATPDYDRCYIWPQGAFQSAYADLALLEAMLAEGFTTGRCANGLSALNPNFDAQTKYQHLCLPIKGHTFGAGTMTTAAEATNITNIVNAINTAATYGCDITLMFHKVQPTSTADGSMNAIGIRVADLTTIADAIKTKITAGTLKAVTLPQLATSPAGNYWQSL